MDVVAVSEKRPLAGETVLGTSFATVPGGKGANQAVAAARLGADVSMIGCVGDDEYGKAILQNFKENGVHTSNIKVLPEVQSGIAHIVVAEGDNSIVVVRGANEFVTPDCVNDARETIAASDMVLIQQEIPAETVEYTSELCRQLGIPLMLNPAPARKVSRAVIDAADYITPNEIEAAGLMEGVRAQELLAMYPGKLVMTEGKSGACYYDGRSIVRVPSFPAETVDTTGAGDTFNAALAVALTEGRDLGEAIRFANRAAAISVTRLGAQGGMPYREHLNSL